MEFKISGRNIGANHLPILIAEIGINHGGSLKVAKEMVLSAKKAGCEIIKHQTHVVEDEMSFDAKLIKPGNSDQSIFSIMEECSLSEKEEFELMKFTEDQGLIFISSPFSRKALHRLIDFGVPAIKIGSGECNNYPLLKEVANYGKPVILSTGMHGIETIKKASKIFEEKNVPLALLHTTNLYPTPDKLVRLGALNEINSHFPDNAFGLSDHTLTNHACFGAVALGASILERHYTDSRVTRSGPDIICSMDENDCKELLAGIEILFQQRGGSKSILKEEQVTRDFAFATVCSTKKINKGETFNNENLWVRRPGVGDFAAEEYETLFGKKAAKNISKNKTLKQSDVQ